jgi:hypothetical protein
VGPPFFSIRKDDLRSHLFLVAEGEPAIRHVPSLFGASTFPIGRKIFEFWHSGTKLGPVSPSLGTFDGERHPLDDPAVAFKREFFVTRGDF